MTALCRPRNGIQGTSLVPFVLVGSGGGRGTRRLDDAARLDALRAHLDPSGNTLHENPRRLQVGVPAAFGFIIRLADVVSRCRAFATDIANACHCSIYRRFRELKMRLEGSDGARHHQGREEEVEWRQR